MRRFGSKIFARRPMNLENRAWGLKTLPHSGPGAFNGSFLSPLSPVSGEFPFSLGRYLLDSEFVPTAATHEILIVFLPVLLPAGGRKESGASFQDRRRSNSGRAAGFRLRYGFTRLNLFCSTEVKEFQSTREWAFIPGTGSSMYSAPPPRLLEDARAIRERAPGRNQ